MSNKIGVNLWTIYGWRPQEIVGEEVLRALANLGAEAIELIVDEEHHTEDALLSRCDKLRRVLEEYGLEVPSVATTLFWRYNLGSQDESLRRKGIALIKSECRVAKVFGAKVVLVVAGIQEPRTPYERTYETAIETLRYAANYAHEEGVIIGVEHVPANFLTTPREYAQFLTDVGHPAVQAYVDIGNAWGTYRGYPENWIGAVKGRIVMVHVKDYSQDSGFTICGGGDLNWSDAFAALRDAGYTGPLIIETPPDYGRRGQDIPAGIEAAQASISWLRSSLCTL